MRFKRIFWLLLTAGLLTLGAWGSAELYRNANEAPAAQVPTTTVKRGNVTFAVYAKGELQGGNSKMLGAPMVGGSDLVITKLAAPGQLVKKDDIVAEFDTTDQNFKLREAEADLAEADQKVIQAQAQLEAKEEEDRYLLIKARADVKLAELEVRRNELVSVIQGKQADLALQAARDLLSQLERDFANRKATSQAGVQIQQAGQTKAKVQADTARKNIEMMTLRAPADGYVNIQQNMNTNFFQTGMQLPILQVGDSVRAGMAVAQIPDLASWEVSARISEADRGHLEKGQTVVITAVAFPDRQFRGKVLDLGGTSGPQWDRKFECKVSLENPTPELRPGMTANLVVTAETLNDALWVPAQALFESDGRSFVHLRGLDGAFTTHDVKLVRRSESQVVIEGVSEGQVVALANPDRSKDKSKDSTKKTPASATQALPGR